VQGKRGKDGERERRKGKGENGRMGRGKGRRGEGEDGRMGRERGKGERRRGRETDRGKRGFSAQSVLWISVMNFVLLGFQFKLQSFGFSVLNFVL
jgi:hypothetical protein